jgi:hypothetical protein
VTADASGGEEAAFAAPRTVFEMDIVLVVVTLKCGGETCDVNPVFLLGVMPGFLDLADYA